MYELRGWQVNGCWIETDRAATQMTSSTDWRRTWAEILQSILLIYGRDLAGGHPRSMIS